MKEKLIKTIFRENISEVKELLDAGADVNFIDAKGDTPLSTAIETDNYEMVKLLLEKKADPNLPGVRFPLLHSAIDVAIEGVKNDGIDINDSTKIIDLLLQYGANPEIKDTQGRTAYDFAKDSHIPAQRLLDKFNQN